MKVESSFHKSPKNALTYHWFNSGILFLIELIIIVALFSMWRYFNWYHFIVYILIFLVFISVIRLLLQPIINYKYRFYRVNDRNVEVKKSFILKKHQMTKIERLQFLEIKSNPILKLLNLNILIFVTAGHELKLPIVSEEEMNQLSEDIFIALRGADSDV
ncbi:hypothetical protein HMPREF2564_08455 [Staphylococcus sp. HMSC068D03]|uniref:PH domain-containing protein n=1 Tax=Staphylococcus TaxID=1279 RepID=UPI00069EC7EA|nr:MULTISPECIES: PH domain-containing protein [Staphylococcus]MBE7296988.1 PH domain-containing protein [Staphylococcus haemolyticus]MBW5899681.1 PH domain-containing protein [Staphylococcus haemolyticus]MCE0455372.1 PH domain-containing protein [Staphylococcus haemolyticus]MCH4355926.1 PH domain-containing protein [Staphylococcus haemolyticus]MCH4477284.1 PH domain-containing protein [Staphylococcus haemolyticus]